MEQTGAGPVEDPVVTVNGQRLTVLYGFQAEYTLSRMNVDPSTVLKLFGKAGKEGGPRVFEASTVATQMDVFTACVAHNFIEQQRPIPTADYWATQFAADKNAWQPACKATMEALVKVLRAAVPPQAQPATESQQATQPN